MIEVNARTSKTMIPGKALCLPLGFCVTSGEISEEQTEDDSKVRIPRNPATETSGDKNARRRHDIDPQEPLSKTKSKTFESLGDASTDAI